MITDRLEFSVILIIVCTDSYSLYEYLVKLRTTKEKRLMIDIIVLRQSYERRKLFEIRQINGQDNPANAITKTNPNKALETFVDINVLQVRMEGQVKRSQAILRTGQSYLAKFCFFLKPQFDGTYVTSTLIATRRKSYQCQKQGMILGQVAITCQRVTSERESLQLFLSPSKKNNAFTTYLLSL